MNKTNTSQIKIRRKGNFRPIMITSKSIKPIERSNNDKNKIYNKQQFYSQIMKKRQSLNHAIYSSSINKAQVIQKLTEKYREELIKNICEDSNNSHKNKSKSKPMTPAIIQVQFQIQNNYNTYRQTKYRKLFSAVGASSDNHNNTESLNKYSYCTNPKNFENFVNSKKNKEYQTLKSVNRSQLYKNLLNMDTDDNNKYFNITKIKPESKKQNMQQKISQQKIKEISWKVEQYQNNLIKKMNNKFHINLQFQYETSPEKTLKTPFLKNQQKIKQNFENPDYEKIYQDITTKRMINKKQHFVFGLTQSNKVNGQQISKQKFQNYKDFLWKINFSNGLYVKIKDQIQIPYKFYVGPGNNSMLIKGIIRRRFWWQVIQKHYQQANFIWTQIKINQFFKYQIIPHEKHNHKYYKGHSFLRNRKIHSALQYNHEYNTEKCTQKQRKTQISKINVLNQQTIPQQDHNSKIFNENDYDIWRQHMRINRKYQQKQQVVYSKRIKTMIKRKKITFIEDSRKLKIQNHFQCNYYLGNKKALFYSLKKYYNYLKKDPFDFIPLTFHISKGIQDPEFFIFLQKYEEFQIKKSNKQLQNIWIIKPGQLTNRGRGITVCSTLDEIKIRLRSKQKAKNGQPHTYIVQKYIQKPLLFNKRKFDIRHYMMMTCVNHKLKGYWYEQGYLRTTSYEYNIKNCKDLYTHLTNDAIQKYSADYGKFQKGNKVSYADFQKYLNANYRYKSKKDSQFIDKYDFYGYILPKMRSLAGDAMRATCLTLSPKRYEHNFQLFGLDFMLDQDMNVYLIQVNTNPCLETSSPLLARLIPQVVQNLFKIAIDPLFPPPYEWPNQKKMQMGDNALEDNRFSLIFDQSQEYEQLLRYNENKTNDQNIGEIDQQDQTYQDEGKQWVEQQK